jgi:hypothetical protein
MNRSDLIFQNTLNKVYENKSTKYRQRGKIKINWDSRNHTFAIFEKEAIGDGEANTNKRSLFRSCSSKAQAPISY